VILEEAKKSLIVGNTHQTEETLEETLSRPAIYARLNCFPNEISPIKLASSAITCIKKFKNDYKIGSFFNLAEWRCRKVDVDDTTPYVPNQQDFKIIIDKYNIIQPTITEWIKWNSEQLSEHLKNILCLSNNDNMDENFSDFANTDRPINNEKILELITKQDLLVFLSINGSVKNNSATVSIRIIIPDTKNNDMDMEWWYRSARVLLICTWKIPNQWGTGQTCINMAEAIGFIIGEYTIPSDLPVLYITDSNKARTLQQNIKFCDKITHHKQIRCIKQGIDYSIANHLEFLISK